jgi:hypothetical protein
MAGLSRPLLVKWERDASTWLLLAAATRGGRPTAGLIRPVWPRCT